MEIEKFIENFANQFDETDVSQFKINTIFRELDEWSSIMALTIIAMIDEEYDVQLKGDDMRNSNTIEELFNVVNSKL
jgi:acyl carrier protein